MNTEWHGLDLTPRYCRDNERMLKLRMAGAIYERRPESYQGDTRIGWWLDNTFLGEDISTAYRRLP
jgi:hypothetical protein